MIIDWSFRALAPLADGRVVSAVIPLADISSTDTISWLDADDSLTDIAFMRICCEGRTLAVVTLDNRILVGLCYGSYYWWSPDPKPFPSLKDITQTVGDITTIHDIYVGNQTLIINTGLQLIIVTLAADGSVSKVGSVDFQCEIDAVCAGRYCGLVKTVDHRLFEVGVFDPEQNEAPTEIVFRDVQGISEMVDFSGRTFLLMDNGWVYEQKNSFKRFMFPNDETITKIIDAGDQILYLTASGRLYRTVKQRDKPVLLEELCEFFIEAVTVLRNESMVVIQHDGNKLSLLHFKYMRYQTRGFKTRLSLVKVEPLSFFDDKGIVSISAVINKFAYICFVSDEGHVYWSRWDKENALFCVGTLVKSWICEPRAGPFTRDPFFDANPLAVNRSVCSIRSAHSIPEE